MNKRLSERSGSAESEGGGGDVLPHRLKTFVSFKNPVYRLYYAAMAGHWSSMHIQMVARSLLIYRITGSGAILGGMALAHSVPLLLLSLPGGAFADRVQKKYILLVGQVSSAVVTLGVALALTLGYLSEDIPGSWWILIAAAMVQGAIMGMMMPARQAIIPEIVSEGQLMNAISLNNMGMNVFRIMAPALTGFIIDASDFDVVYYIMTGMYLMASICVFLLPRTGAVAVQGRSTLTDVLAGLRYVRRETTILLILVFGLFCTVLGMPYMFLMPMFTEDILKVSATGMGILISVSGFGAILASLVLASMPNRKRGRILLMSGLIFGLALMSFAFSHYWYLSLVIIVFVGMGQTGHMTLGNTLLQYYVDAAYRGRVMSFMMMGFGFASLGTFIAGMLAEVVGVQRSIGGLAMALALISIMVLLFNPRLRRLD